MVDRLLDGAPQYDVYGVLLTQLLHISEAVDAALARQTSSFLRGVDIGRMTHRLAVELQAIGKDTVRTGREPVNLLDAARTLILRCRTVEKEEPLLLLAHDFARASRDPGGVGCAGQLARLILDAPADHLRVGYLPDPFEPFFQATAQLDLPAMLRRRLREEGAGVQSLNLRLVRELHQVYIAS